jgi:hypothetical protein
MKKRAVELWRCERQYDWMIREVRIALSNILGEMLLKEEFDLNGEEMGETTNALDPIQMIFQEMQERSQHGLGDMRLADRSKAMDEAR